MIMLLASLLWFLPVFTQGEFVAKQVSSGCLESETRIEYTLDRKLIGFAHYTRIPFSIYALHSLFVYPEFRGKGYGKELIKCAVQKIKQAGGRLIFIQPGPFDLKGDMFQDLPEGNEKTEGVRRLVKLYRAAGFRPTNKLISQCSRLIYYLAAIQQNPKYLMSYGC